MCASRSPPTPSLPSRGDQSPRELRISTPQAAPLAVAEQQVSDSSGVVARDPAAATRPTSEQVQQEVDYLVQGYLESRHSARTRVDRSVPRLTAYHNGAWGQFEESVRSVAETLTALFNGKLDYSCSCSEVTVQPPCIEEEEEEEELLNDDAPPAMSSPPLPGEWARKPPPGDDVVDIIVYPTATGILNSRSSVDKTLPPELRERPPLSKPEMVETVERAIDLDEDEEEEESQSAPRPSHFPHLPWHRHTQRASEAWRADHDEFEPDVLLAPAPVAV